MSAQVRAHTALEFPAAADLAQPDIEPRLADRFIAHLQPGVEALLGIELHAPAERRRERPLLRGGERAAADDGDARAHVVVVALGEHERLQGPRFWPGDGVADLRT